MGEFVTEHNLHKDNYMKIPIALFVQDKYKALNSNDRMVYVRVFNHIHLSAMNSDRFKDGKGRLYCYITQEKLAEDLGISPRTVRTCLHRLEEVDLIERHEEIVHLQKKHKIFVAHVDEGKSSFYSK